MTVAVLPVEVVVLTHVTAVVIFFVMVQWNESMGDVVRIRCPVQAVVPAGGKGICTTICRILSPRKRNEKLKNSQQQKNNF